MIRFGPLIAIDHVRDARMATEIHVINFPLSQVYLNASHVIIYTLRRYSPFILT